MEFYIPTETGEFLAFCAAAATGLFGLFALFAPGTDSSRSRSRRSLVNMMIAKIDTTFFRPIDPNDFEGWVAVNKLYVHDGMPFLETSFRFMDRKGGLATGHCRGVVFVKNL